MSIWGNVFTLQTAHGNFLILCQMVLLPNINFLISKKKLYGSFLRMGFNCLKATMKRQLLLTTFKQNKTPKLEALVLLSLDLSSLLHKQTELYKHKKINRYLYCNEQHLLSALFLFWFQWNTEQVFMFGMYLVRISCIRIPSEILPSFKLGNSIPTT